MLLQLRLVRNSYCIYSLFFKNTKNLIVQNLKLYGYGELD